MKFLSSAPANLLLALALFSCLKPIPTSAAEESPEVRLEIRLIEILARENKQIGFDWYLGQTPMGNPGETAPGSPQGNPQESKNVATLSGILTDPQFRQVVRALEQREHAKTLAAPEGVTLSGRPLVVKRPDGWTFQITPEKNISSGRITMAVSLSQDKGEYAGFNLSSTVRVAPGEAAVFSDTFTGATKKKGESGPQKRLILTVVPTL